MRPLASQSLARRHDRLHAATICICIGVCVCVYWKSSLDPSCRLTNVLQNREIYKTCVYIHTYIYSDFVCVLFLVVINALRDSYDRLDTLGPLCMCVSQQYVRQMGTFILIAAK